jgi:hypothetical protein
MLGQRPFVSFEIRMSSRTIYQVRYPDFAHVLTTKFVIVDQDADNVIICSLDQIESANTPQSAA